MEKVHGNLTRHEKVSLTLTGKPKVCSICGEEGHNRRSCPQNEEVKQLHSGGFWNEAVLCILLAALLATAGVLQLQALAEALHKGLHQVILLVLSKLENSSDRNLLQDAAGYFKKRLDSATAMQTVQAFF